MQACFPTGEPICGFGVLCANLCLWLSNKAGLHLPFHMDRFPLHFCIAFREKERGQEGGRERHQYINTSMWERNIGCLLVCSPTRDWTLNLVMCPDWELNLWTFALQEDAPTTWATPARADFFFFFNFRQIRVYWHLIVILICIPLMINTVEHLIMWLFATFIFSFVNYQF